MFRKKNKGRKIQFINLAEHLAMQNDIVSQTVDSMLLHVLNNENATDRCDWPEISKTLENSDLSESQLPSDTPLSGPKAGRKPTWKSESKYA